MNDNPINRGRIKDIYRERFVHPLILSPNDTQLLYLLHSLPKDRNTRILDAGCGDGRYAEYLVNYGYLNVYAVDLFEHSPTKIVDYQCASVDALPFKDNFFDYVFSNSVIFYIDPPVKALSEFNRVLKSGSVLMFTAHTKWSLFTLLRVIKRDLLKSANMQHLDGVKFYSARYYQQALTTLGFDVLLRDGWKFSFFIYPMYLSASKYLRKIANINLPEKKAYIIKNNLLGKIKSEISYHSVFIAKKK